MRKDRRDPNLIALLLVLLICTLFIAVTFLGQREVRRENSQAPCRISIRPARCCDPVPAVHFPETENESV